MLYTRTVLACLYDVHGNLPALEAVLADARERGAERFVLGGDYSAFGAWPAECAARVAELDAVVKIRGNWERWVAEMPPEVRDDAGLGDVARAVLAALGPAAVAELGALPADAVLDGALVCHASPGSDMRAFEPQASAEDAELLAGVREPRVIVGHLHVQFKRGAGGVEVLNPGSVGLPVDGDRRAAYALLHDDGEAELRRVEYDVAASIARLREVAAGTPWVDEIAGRLERAGA